MTSAVLSAPMSQAQIALEAAYVTPDGVHRVESAAQLHDLLKTIQDRRRRNPVIVTSMHGKAPLIRLGTVREAVGDQAVFYELTNQAAADWKEQWPDACAFGGATRLFAPHTAHTSRLIRTYPEDDPHDAENRVISWIREEKWRNEPVRTGTPCRPSKTQSPQARSEPALAASQRENKRRIERLETDNRKFVRLVRGIDLFAGPADRFHFEVQVAYLRFVPECDRSRWPLPENWAASSEFIAQVNDHAKSIERNTILRAIVDVLTGRARETGRQVRAHRAGPGGNDPQVIRADGARAFRCNVQTNTAAARRLTWWQHPDHQIELAIIAAHDNSGV